MKKCVVLFGMLTTCSMCAFADESLWQLAKQNQQTLKVSTLFTAQNVRDYLSTEEGIDKAIDWCNETGVTRVFIETFRSSYWAERKILERARDRFKAAGFDVSGCVTTTTVGKKSTGWDLISCYTDKPTRQTIQKIFEYTASMFDEIMIDDFLFSDCQCDECRQAKGDRSWSDYHCDVMVALSRNEILAASRKVNPKVSIIIKYPQWYDRFHERGYDVVRQTKDFDTIWVGTETRDYDDERWGGTVQYEAYFIMRWLGDVGGSKCGGGWFDWLGTTEKTYLEQANQTVLAGAKEMLLFCYGGLQSSTGPANIKVLREQMPALFKLAELIRDRPPRGVAAPKPPSSDPGKEAYVYDFVGMMGIPLVPTASIDTDARAAFYPVHVLKDKDFLAKFRTMLSSGKPILITDGLFGAIPTDRMYRPNLKVLPVQGAPKGLLKLTREELNDIRTPLLKGFGIRLDAPNKAALYLFGDDLVVIENFNDEPADVTVTFDKPVNARKALAIPIESEVEIKTESTDALPMKVPARTLVAVEY